MDRIGLGKERTKFAFKLTLPQKRCHVQVANLVVIGASKTVIALDIDFFRIDSTWTTKISSAYTVNGCANKYTHVKPEGSNWRPK